jgi:hypothetical protein
MPTVTLTALKYLIENPTLKHDIGDGYTIQFCKRTFKESVIVVFKSRSFKYLNSKVILLSHGENKIAQIGIVKDKINDEETLLDTTAGFNEALEKYSLLRKHYDKLKELFGDAVSFGSR